MKRTPLKRKTPLRAGPPKPAAEKRTRVKRVKTEGEKKLAGLLRKADDMARSFCKRFGKCEACGEGGMKCGWSLEWCHLKSRGQGNAIIRHHPENSMCLCKTHHKFFTMHPDLWTEFCERKNPGIWDRLNRLLQQRRDTKLKTPLSDVYQAWIAYYEAQEERNGLDEAA